MHLFCLGTAQIRPNGIISTASYASEKLYTYIYRQDTPCIPLNKSSDSVSCFRVFIQTSAGYPGVNVWLVNEGEQLLPTTQDTKILRIDPMIHAALSLIAPLL